MRLEKLQVSGFGHLHGLDVELPGPVTVLYGPNEAGKSTLLGFVRAMLFGIPSRTFAAERFEPARGGVHGGALTIAAEDGSRWVIERYAQPPEGRSLPGTRGDRLRITRSDADGRLQEMTQEQMQRELLGGLSKAMFKQLFAVSLTELQEVGVLQSEELSRYLFHAGIGGGSAVLRGEKKLAQDMDKLYRPRGRNQEIAQLLQAVERLEREAEAAKALLPRYNEVLEQLEELAGELTASEAERAAVARETARLQKAAESRGDWLQREAIRAELAALPAAARFPEQGLARWQALQAEKDRLQLERSDWARRREALRAELAALQPRAPVLAREPLLRQLAGRLPAYEARRRELAELAGEAALVQARLAECLRSIHPAWRAEDLRAFAGTVGEREQVRRFSARFAAYDKEMELLQSERSKLERAAAGAETARANAAARLEDSAAAGRRQFAMLLPQERGEIRALWSELRGELDRWRDSAASRRAEVRAADAEALAETRLRALYRKLFAAACVLTVALPAVLWLAAESLWSAAFTGVLLLGLDVYLAIGAFRGKPAGAAGRRSAPASRRPAGRAGEAGEEMETRLEALLSRFVRHPLTAASAAGSGFAASLRTEAWDEEERQLRRLMEEWQLWDQRHDALEADAAAAQGHAAAVKDELQHVERELSRREGDFAKLAAEWERWLEERRLSADLSPEAAMDVFHLAGQGREWLSRIDGLTDKISGLRAENERFERECLALQDDGGPGGQAADAPEAKRAADDPEAKRAANGGVYAGIPLSSAAAPGPEAGSDGANGRAAPETAGSGAGAAIKLLEDALAELERELERKAGYDRLAAKLAPLDEEGRRLEDRLQQVMQAEEHLLAEGEAEGGEEFLRIGAAAERREALEKELRQRELALFAGMDEDKRNDLERLLKGVDEAELKRRLEEARAAGEGAEVRWRKLQERRGRLLQEQESLEARCRQEDLAQQLAEQQAALEEYADKYAVMAVCRELISRVRRIYEEERQPAVLQAASRYFERMTGGTYRRIVMKIGSQELMAEHAEHGPIDSARLSRGTAEQLYLSMRLALSEAVAGGQGSLPLLLDDLFVNFDASRLEGALSVLRTVAKRQQIIMMTCHEHVVGRLKAELPTAHIVEM
ncbi:MAG: AAA family ATPase [Paenibacillus macerans]|uniref:AAA family ATPase n=1 Tax=Paenibacillus TaxID=44249 RepID=UPI00242DEF2B|nr:AAA family ATPase [Paenibacillus macerans]MBS5911225.1 AAA family ATPase [Paenibacillus macerans]MDU7472614.1 AAA family ATPase [Paenibacillus macerans]